MYVSGREPDTRKQRPTPLSKVLHGLWSLKSVFNRPPVCDTQVLCNGQY